MMSIGMWGASLIGMFFLRKQKLTHRITSQFINKNPKGFLLNSILFGLIFQASKFIQKKTN